MKLNKLTLTNWECHKKLTLQFKPGLNGIVGKNGSGKSSVLRALSYAFLGNDRSLGTIEESLSYGSTAGQVEIDFEQGDTSYNLLRKLKPSGQRLVLPDQTVTKANEMDKELYRLLGTTTKSLKANVFVAQGDLDSILYASNGQRMAEFLETFGLTRAQDAFKAVSSQVSQFQAVPGLRDQLADATRRFEEASQSLENLKASLDTIDAEIWPLRQSEQALAAAAQRQQILGMITDADKRLEAARAALVAAVSAREVTSAEASRLRALADETRSNHKGATEVAIADIMAQRAAYTAAQKRAAEREAVLQQLAALRVVSQEELEDLHARARAAASQEVNIRGQLAGTIARKRLANEEALEQRLSDAKAELKLLPVAATASETEVALLLRIQSIDEDLKLFADGTCPTCGAPCEHFDTEEATALRDSLQADLTKLREQAAADLAAERARLTQVVTEVQAELTKIQAAANAALTKMLQKATDNRQTLEAEYATAKEAFDLRSQAQQTLKALQADSEVEAPDLERLANLQQLLEKIDRLQHEAREAELQAQQALAAFTAAENAVKAATEFRAGLTVSGEMPSADEMARLRQDVLRLAERMEARRKIVDDVTTAEVQQQVYQRVISDLSRQLADEEKSLRWLQFCTKTRELLHVQTGLPALMLREYAKRLNSRIAYYLELLEAPFELSLDHTLSFVAAFDDGRKLAAIRLSGGQKIIASVAFRLAMVDVFASDVQLLILDEPTVYLDRESLGHFQKLLLQLKTMAGASGRQIILVTHEASLTGFFDHEIQIGAPAC